MDRIARLNELFSQVCKSGTDRLNYVSWIELRPSIAPGKSLGEIVKGALGDEAVVGQKHVTSGGDVLTEVNECLRFEGDYGSHPDIEILKSDAIQQAIDEITHLLGELLNESKRITSFHLDEGHPFYPVFWDFAYAIELNDRAYVLIGCASD